MNTEEQHIDDESISKKCEVKFVDLAGQYEKIKGEVDSAIGEVLSSSAFINGPQVKEFEAHLASYLGVKHVIGCGNGTDALQIALMALGLERGDEVIVPAFTYVATAEVIGLLGLTPVLVDVDDGTFNVGVEHIRKALTPRTKAIVPVHLFGQSCDMGPILDFAGEYGLWVVEDNAQAIGAEYCFREDCYRSFPGPAIRGEAAGGEAPGKKGFWEPEQRPFYKYPDSGTAHSGISDAWKDCLPAENLREGNKKIAGKGKRGIPATVYRTGAERADEIKAIYKTAGNAESVLGGVSGKEPGKAGRESIGKEMRDEMRDEIRKEVQEEIREDFSRKTGEFFVRGTVRKTGTIGHIGCTSFFPSKNLGCYGDGGALLTDDDELAEKIRMIANHGQRKKYHHKVIGCNSRLDTIQAAVLEVKLKHLEEYNKARYEAARYYTDRLRELDPQGEYFITPQETAYSTHVYHQYTLKIRNPQAAELSVEPALPAGLSVGEDKRSDAESKPEEVAGGKPGMEGIDKMGAVRRKLYTPEAKPGWESAEVEEVALENTLVADGGKDGTGEAEESPGLFREQGAGKGGDIEADKNMPYPGSVSGRVREVLEARCIHFKEMSVRDRLKAYLSANGIPSMVYYPLPLQEQEAFRGIAKIVDAGGEIDRAYAGGAKDGDWEIRTKRTDGVEPIGENGGRLPLSEATAEKNGGGNAYIWQEGKEGKEVSTKMPEAVAGRGMRGGVPEERRKEEALAVSAELAASVLSLPMHTELTRDQQDRVIEGIREFFRL